MKRIAALGLLMWLVAACVPVTPEPVPTSITESATATAQEILATPTAAPQGDLVVSWQSPDCDVARFTLRMIAYGKCDGSLTLAPIQPGDLSAALQEYADRFAPFESASPAGQLTFKGQGKLVASPAEQQAIGYWARLRFQEANSGQPDAARGLALSWHREGGIAGFCDDLAVYLDGTVTATTCRGQQTGKYPAYHLTGTQLEELYAWTDALQQTVYSYKDPAVADAMSIDLVLAGGGAQPATDQDIQTLSEYAGSLFAQVQQSQQPTPELEAAQTALLAYFDALNTGDYAGAERLYGGSYEMLRTWNPDTRASDLNALWELACTHNGLKCMPVRAVVLARQTTQVEFKFTVEFTYADGSLFRQGPCCGDTGPSIDTFEYTVKETGPAWKVIELPPYVP